MSGQATSTAAAAATTSATVAARPEAAAAGAGAVATATRTPITKTTWFGFVSGGLAACAAVTFTNPFETVKIRLQLQGELAARAPAGTPPGAIGPYGNVFSSFATIYRNEGIRGLQKGLVPAYAYQFVMNGARLGLYQPLKGTMSELILGSRTADHMAVNVLTGSMCGVIGAFFGSPLFLVKTRLQAYSKAAPVGTQHEYRGMIHGLSEIWKSGGIRGLWRGSDAAMLRTAAGSSVQLASYDRIKREIMALNHPWFGDNIQTHFAASMVSGFLVCCAMNAPDVIMNRMYNDRSASGGSTGSLYRNPLDCLVKSVRAEGIKVLGKGFWPHYLRIGPHTVLMFVFAEQIRARVKTVLGE
ncbi:mitochondrial carrier [Ramicandelaber brevisporus]|nr:mitochondrial carrier [Ramicandelaber brevisporus]